jgi:hypothetical protein
MSLAEILFGAFGHDNRSPVLDAIQSAVSTIKLFIDQKIIEDNTFSLCVLLGAPSWVPRGKKVGAVSCRFSA